MAVQRNPVFISPEEFLEIRRASDKRLEYISGEIYEWSTGTGEHGRISANITGELTIGLRGKPCGPGVDISVLAPASYLVPDVVVYCGRGDFTEENILKNPVTIVEVLSPSTRDFDRGEKWMRYRFLPSLMHYMLVSQDKLQVELFTRETNGWHYAVYTGLDAVVDLVHIDCRLTLASIYERVDFESTNT
jgi:Uma2 family endonuclease